MLKIGSNGTDVLSDVLASNVRFLLWCPSGDRALTLSHTDGQPPAARIAAHLTGNSNRRSSLSPRSKGKNLHNQLKTAEITLSLLASRLRTLSDTCVHSKKQGIKKSLSVPDNVVFQLVLAEQGESPLPLATSLTFFLEPSLRGKKK